MDFKPTLWKTIGSIIVGLLLIIISTTIVDQSCYPKQGSSCPIFSIETFYYLLFYFYIPIIIVIYLIWSLIQKKK